MTNVELDLATYIDQHLFIKERIRGGLAMISHRYAWTNVPGMENYNVSKRNSYIMYLDANNWYGWVMSQPLLKSNFKWLTDEEMEELEVMMVPENNSRGYISECDLGKYHFYYVYIHVNFIKWNNSFLCISDYLHDFIKWNVSFSCISEYPHELLGLHTDYPSAPERLQIEENILSYYQRYLLHKKNELDHPLPHFKVVLGTGIASHQCPSCFIVWSITSGWKTTSTSTLVNVQLR